ncbi:hypothetical protein AB0B92_15565 [Streptomyces hygroscopicus]|uniref:hypothetical protein n=1 Tax=Streptomyces hygroscopicus TaxID=1912 RepID=UPI0033DCCED2
MGDQVPAPAVLVIDEQVPAPAVLVTDEQVSGAGPDHDGRGHLFGPVAAEL